MMNTATANHTSSHTIGYPWSTPGELGTSPIRLVDELINEVVARAPEILTAISLYAISQWQTGFGFLRSKDYALQLLGLRLVLDALSCTPHPAMELVNATRALLPAPVYSTVRV